MYYSWTTSSLVCYFSFISSRCPYSPWTNACYTRLPLFWNTLQAFTCASLCWICNLCFSWCVVYIASLLVCQVHHLFCELFRAESCSSHHVLSEAHTIFLELKEWSSAIVNDQYPFILLSMNTVLGFLLPSPSKESKLKEPQKKLVSYLHKWVVLWQRAWKIPHPPQTNKNPNKMPSFHHWAGELVLYMRRMGDICNGYSEMNVTFWSVNIYM